MSTDQRIEPAKQFDQASGERPEPLRFDQQYKSIGISAVSAAAQYSPKGPKKTPQMS